MLDDKDLSGSRRRQIVKLVREKEQVSVHELCETFKKSEATIRRDLSVIASKGLVTRTHGGVLINLSALTDIPNESRKEISSAQKKRIGYAAIDMLRGDEVVFIDAGTTSLALAEVAHLKPNCQYITTSLGVAQLLRAQNIKNFFLIGGSYNEVNDSFVGALAMSAIRSLTFDISFLCCTSINVYKGVIGVSDYDYCQIQQEIVSASKANFVIADSNKFAAMARMWTAKFSDLDGIITDKDLDDEYVTQLKQKEMEVVLV